MRRRHTCLCATSRSRATRGPIHDDDRHRRSRSPARRRRRSRLAKQDFAAANAAFDQAIAAIGDSYADTRSLDDTGMQLTMAQAKARQGDLAAAAKLKAQIVRAWTAQAACK